MTDAIETRTIPDATIPGLSYRVTVVPDLDAGRPEDNGDCYTPAQIAAWSRDDWLYVGVIVTPVIGGTDITASEQSLWGNEYGDFLLTDEDDNTTGRRRIDLDYMIGGETGHPEYAYPVPDLISEARESLPGHVIEMARQFSAVAAELDPS